MSSWLQILTLTRQTKDSLESSDARVRALDSTIGSFLAQHNEHVDFASESTWSSQLQAKLGTLSHRLAKSDSDSTALERSRVQLEAAEAESDTQLKKMLQLQAQVNSIQASKQRSEKSMQQIATKELQLVESIEVKDREIERLETQITKVFGGTVLCGAKAAAFVAQVSDVVLLWMCKTL
jgi:chromosome segregation ATPase